MLARKALAGTAGAPKEYVEDVFSTDLFVGNSSSQTVTNNIDLSGDGGLVWLKNRGPGTDSHRLFDTARTLGYYINTNSTDAQATDSGRDLTAYSSTGYTLNVSDFNTDDRWVSWTFRKAKKFFDIVTYTGNGSNRTISHNLGSTPGCIIVKRTDATAGWPVYHRSIGASQALELQITNAAFSSSSYWNNTAPTSTVFTVGTDSYVNANGGTYVAYLFAHDAGGFGDAGSDNVISCGSFTTNGSGEATVTLNYEPQWLLLKPSSTTGNWLMVDTMRGWNVNAGSNIQRLRANLSDAEDTGGQLNPTSTGFKTSASGALVASQTYIYIAIRRGPMKTPTSGTSVFTPVSTSGNTSEITAGFPVDFALGKEAKNGAGYGNYAIDRLRGGSVLLETNTTGAEYTSQTFKFDSNTKFLQSGSGVFYGPSIYWLMRRAPGFFDVVCYTGTGSATTFSHNLGVVPEMMIVKRRSGVDDWAVYHSALGNTKYLWLNSTNAEATSQFYWNNTTPTTSVFTLGTQGRVNDSGSTYVAYLFASVSGVSKVGSYTGNGSSVTVTTGFQPRFIMVKRTDSTGNWIVSDSARGLVSGSDPYLLLNSTAAEDTDEDWVDVSSTGFTVNETSAANANVNTGTYIYLAIA